MTDMDKMMIEKVALAMLRASARRHYGDAVADDPVLWETEPEAQRAEWLADAEAAISAYNPDDRLREAATTFLEFWQQEPNGAVTVRAAIRLGSALSPLPQGDG